MSDTAWTGGATHRVPAGGLDARTRPDPGLPPSARIDPRVEVEAVDGELGWAHIRCDNGWEAWVDGRSWCRSPGPRPGRDAGSGLFIASAGP